MRVLVVKNALDDCYYVEPYAGGASVALSLLYDELAARIYINDINLAVHSFWWAVLNEAPALCRRVRRVRVTMREWERQKAVLESPESDPLDLAFAAFFLNRTNRSGIISGGVIGGREQAGPWGIGARFNAEVLARRIERVHSYRTRIVLTRVDAAQYLRQMLPSFGQRAFAYLDPPYYVKGAGLYDNYYSHEDHTEIASIVAALQCPWVVSYDADPAILRLYRGCRRELYGLSYSAGSTPTRGHEVMFFSPQLRVPDLDSPANVRNEAVLRTREAVWGIK